jgi:hypothetical protein
MQTNTTMDATVFFSAVVEVDILVVYTERCVCAEIANTKFLVFSGLGSETKLKLTYVGGERRMVQTARMSVIPNQNLSSGIADERRNFGKDTKTSRTKIKIIMSFENSPQVQLQKGGEMTIHPFITL